jgi:hypothetical protein
LGRYYLLKHVTEGQREGKKWWEDEQEEVSSYSMNLKKR